MKKVISLILLVLLIVTSFAGCGTPNKKSEAQMKEEIKKELQAEMAAGQQKDEQNASKAQKVDMKDKDALYEFVKKDIKDLVRKDFDLWEVNYLDITGDGNDEAVISGVYGYQYPQKMQIISGDSGEFKRIPSDIELYQYENKPELKDGFFVVTGRIGGTGTESTLMDLYIYNGSEIKKVLSNLELHYRYSGKNADIERTGKIDGKLTNFIFTITEHDNATEEDKIVLNDLCEYNENTKTFEVKSIGGTQTGSGNNFAPPTNAGNGNQGSTGQSNSGGKVNLADLKNGDSIGGGLTIKDIEYRKGSNRGSFTLAGTTTLNGEFWFDEEFGVFGFDAYDSSVFSTIVIPGPDEDGVYNSNDTFEYKIGSLAFRNYDYVRSALSSDQLKEIENGKNVHSEITVKDIKFSYKFGSESGSSCELVKINTNDSGGNQQSISQPNSDGNKVYLADLRNGDYVGNFAIKNIEYRKNDDRASFTIEGSMDLEGEFYFDNMWENIAFRVTDSYSFPYTIVIEGPNGEIDEYKPGILMFTNEDELLRFFSDSDLNNMKNGQSKRANIMVQNLNYSMKFYTEGGTSTKFLKIN